MRYSVSLLDEVDFAPETEVAEILQNVRTVIATMVGTVPLARDLAITWEHLDKPLPLAKVLQQEAFIDAVEEYEPRARIVRIDYEESEQDAMQGRLNPRVIVAIGDEEEAEEEW